MSQIQRPLSENETEVRSELRSHKQKSSYQTQWKKEYDDHDDNKTMVIERRKQNVAENDGGSSDVQAYDVQQPKAADFIKL